VSACLARSIAIEVFYDAFDLDQVQRADYLGC